MSVICTKTRVKIEQIKHIERRRRRGEDVITCFEQRKKNFVELIVGKNVVSQDNQVQ